MYFLAHVTNAATGEELATLEPVVGAIDAPVAAIEQFVGRPLDQQPREEVSVLVRLAIDVVSASIESINPDRGQRTSHVCAYAMSRALAAGTGPPRAA